MSITLSRTLKALPLVIFMLGSIAFALTPPEVVVGAFGLQNVYLFLFTLAFVGSIASVTGVPYTIVMVALVAGGLNPLILGLLAALGVTLGDMGSYFLGYVGRAILTPSLEKSLARLTDYQARHPRLMLLVIFLYSAFIPMSNNFLSIPLGLARYSLWRLMVPLALGTVIFNLGVAYSAAYGYEWLHQAMGFILPHGLFF